MGRFPGAEGLRDGILGGCVPLALLAPLVSLARSPTTEILGGMGVDRISRLREFADNGSPRRNTANLKFRPRGLCPQAPSRGLAAPCTPAVRLTVSPRGTPPRPPAFPQVGVGVVGVAVDRERWKDG